MLTKLISVLLTVSVFFGLPASPVEDTPAPVTQSADFTVIACSDLQPKSSFEEGEDTVNSILSAMIADGVSDADGFFCCGDYDCHSYGVPDKTRAGIRMFKDTFSGMMDEENMVFVQGNHDASPGSNVGLSPSGNNDPESGDYGVFVLHNEDYMWANKDEERIKQTGQKLINYLNEKLAEGFDRPIFILSHLALHYNMRTRNDGDGKYARYLFDAINEAGAKGLNIVVMYGHDHSNGWDDYLGGSSVYLPKGDEMLVADFSSSKYSYKTLNFTYLNAGFVGYYDNHNGADDTLTMTVFQVKDDTMTISRYDANGKHVLKSEGFTNTYKNETGYKPNKTVYPSPQVVTFTEVTDSSPIKDIMELPEGGKAFEQITKTSELVSGEKYLLVCARASNKIMLPSVVTKSNSSGARIGFDLSDSPVYVDDTVYGDFDDLLWTFTKQNNGRWLIGDGESYAKFTSTSTNKVTATFESSGDLFVVRGSGTFTFVSDKYCLNYNSRGLVNGYDSDPAEFYIFKHVGNSVTVSGGEAFVDGEVVSAATAGKTVTVKATLPEGTRFDKWKITKGDIEMTDLYAEEVSFVMPDGSVKLIATYKNIVIGDANGDDEVTNADVLMMFRNIFNPIAFPISLYASDVNRDGEVTNADVLLVFRYIFSPEKYPLE